MPNKPNGLGQVTASVNVSNSQVHEPGLKRLKIALACEECRNRKVRCDGAEPSKSPCHLHLHDEGADTMVEYVEPADVEGNPIHQTVSILTSGLLVFQLGTLSSWKPVSSSLRLLKMVTRLHRRAMHTTSRDCCLCSVLKTWLWVHYFILL